MEKIFNKLNILKILDVVMCILIVLLAVKKGGFYIQDSLWFNIVSISIIIIYFLILKFVKIKNNDKNLIKNKYIEILNMIVLLIPIIYLLPILFNKYVDFNASFSEFLRYLNFTLIYFFLINSVNKKYYLNTIIVVGVVLVIFGIDGMGLRIFEPYLQNLQTGYLNKDFSRMSSTIQYANTFALIIAMANGFVFAKLVNKNKYNKLKINILYMISGLFTFSIILSGSRTVIILYIFMFLAYIIASYLRKIENKNNENILLIFIFQVAFYSYIASLIQANNFISTNKVYAVVIFAVCIFFIIQIILQKILLMIKENNILKKNKISENIKIVLSIITFLALILVLSLDKPLYINSHSKDNIKKIQLYNLNENELNNLDIEMELLKEDTRYIIYLYEESKNFNQELVARFDYYNKTSSNVNYSFTPDVNIKNLIVVIECTKGNMKIESLKLNNVEKKLAYTFLPSELVFRIEDILKGSSSVNDRVSFYKDSIKIVNKSPLVGFGGDSFKYKYKEVQEFEYKSTKAHSMIFQTLVDTGLIGVSVLIAILIFSIISLKHNYKNINKSVMFSYFILIMHSIVDLNFSYMITLVIFAILLSNIVLDSKE